MGKTVMQDIYKIAAAFRTAIEEAVRNGEIRKMASFPTGCCGMASDLLQRYLFEQGVFTWYMSGRYGNGVNGESHAWLETMDGNVVDITGDQYKYKKLRFTDPVYVGLRANGFHDKFELDEPKAYSQEDDPFGRNHEFDLRYEVVKRYMKKCT